MNNKRWWLYFNFIVIAWGFTVILSYIAGGLSSSAATKEKLQIATRAVESVKQDYSVLENSFGVCAKKIADRELEYYGTRDKVSSLGSQLQRCQEYNKTLKVREDIPRWLIRFINRDGIQSWYVEFVEPDWTLRVSDVERHNSDHMWPQYYLSTGEIFNTKKELLDDLAK